MSVSKQDQIINEQMLNANMAVKTLQAMGLSVNKVTVGDVSRPEILIAPGRACKQLQSGYTKIINRAGRRVTERVAFVAECQVKWEEISA